MKLDTPELKRLAVAGLKAEIARLQDVLDSLLQEQTKPKLVLAPKPTRRKRKPMTLAERKAIGERMRAMWAAKRKNKKG